ncbi:double-CXXCG motif protein [Myxococcus eversor]|uniref:SitI6 family double-CXXCG motif immunity protein n=1 Tax=Myxococcus eversor TaxID=2709661 RepID=UPI0013D3B2A7|nr:double-CXXCG motif protein [Myxococcus eversor]
MKYFRVEQDLSSRYSGELNATHRWGLPGVEPCPLCGQSGATLGLEYPCVDLSSLPRVELERLSDPSPVPLDELERLRQLVRPMAPLNAVLDAGTEFGPLTGTGSGSFGSFFMPASWSLCIREEALVRLREAGAQGLQGSAVSVRFRTKSPPMLLNLQLDVQGRFHPDALTWARKPPCPRCGISDAEGPLPEPIVLDTATLPEDVDLFRLADAPGIIIATEQLVDAATRLSLDGAVFRAVAAR